ncbi:MAG TPA: hypothetical protein VHF47_09095 [Acidimicrobiales bacterium]|nr:hypothetical protein [Acidimicrobiales bacterium]
MAINPLHPEFIIKQRRIALGDRALVAIAAHVEVRSMLRAAAQLMAHGLDDILIGSYARRVSIWPGKDVDVLGRLMADTIETLGPDLAYQLFLDALEPYAAQGRLTPQPRSLKVEFGPTRAPAVASIREAAKEYRWESERVERVVASLGDVVFEFSVDVVPAVIWGDHYGIPDLARLATGERYRTGQWRKTNPVKLTELTQKRNRSPLIAGVGAYVRTVRGVKQVKAYHLPDAKPSSLYYELILHEGFASGAIAGDTWADITASALRYIASRLATATVDPVCDPVLVQPYLPAPSAIELEAARAVFDDQARRAERACSESRCQAAIGWRAVFGGNAKWDQVFPLPDGCRGSGAAMGAATANLASGGTSERSFGAS